MKNMTVVSAVVAVTCLAGSAWAAGEKSQKQQTSGMEMQRPKPGPEDEKLAPFFAKGTSWTGEVPAGAMGPESKATRSHGKATCSAIFNGLAYHCDVQDTIGSSTWKGRLTTAWDRLSNSYKATLVDNMGTITTWTGEMSEDGNKYVLTSNEEMKMGAEGPAFKDRLTWDKSSGRLIFTDEHQVDGNWQLFEKADMGVARKAPSERKNTSGTNGR